MNERRRGGLSDEFRDFLLSSSKNTEQFSEQLLEALNVPTALDSALLLAVRNGSDVVVAGTAGSGKTHLLSRLRVALPGETIVEFGEQVPGGRRQYISVVSDLTALSDGEKTRAFERSTNCSAIVICANEGTLLYTARLESKSFDRRAREKYENGIHSLHRIQRGELVSGGVGPVVIDAAGFDPTFGDALSTILGTDLLGQVVNESNGCQCDPKVCPRRQTWLLLNESEVRKRLSSLVAAAALEAEGFSFRVLWNFVADLALGGDCEMRDTPPTAAWFWRVFNGESHISDRLRQSFPLRRIPIPRFESRLWYGDWSWFEQPGVLVGALDRFPVLPSSKPCNFASTELGETTFEWLKAEAMFCLASDPFHSARTMVTAGELWGAISNEQQHVAIQALNRYMTYGLGTAGSNLELWIDYSMERRLERPEGQVSVGKPSSVEFEIVRNRACSGLPDEVEPAFGGRLFLRHKLSGASLALTRELLSVIIGGRSFRMSDRIHTEVDWLLMSFFSEISGRAATPDHLRVALYDFRARSMRQFDWDVVAHPPSLTLTTKG